MSNYSLEIFKGGIALMEEKKTHNKRLMIAVLQLLLESKHIDDKTFNIAISKIENQ